MTTPEIVLLASFPLMFVAAIGKEVVKDRLRTRRHIPVLAVVFEVAWLASTPETTYRDQLAERLFQRLGLRAKPEGPLPTGTRLDLRFEYAGELWFITLKQDLDNQERLRLQGEAADIIDECHARRLARAVLLIGLARSDATPTKRGHVHDLERHLRSRAGRLVADRKEPLDLAVYVINVPTAASPS